MTCPKCDGLGFVERDPVTRAMSRCPACSVRDLGGAIPEQFREEPAVIEVHPKLRRVLESGWPINGTWCVVLWGSPGSGKTTEATWLWRRVASRVAKPSAWIELHQELEDARRGVNEAGEREFVAKCGRPGVVLFDDLANETPGAMRERLVIEVLGDRYNRRLPTIVTTNLSGADLWDERLASRLRAGISVQYAGEDRRKGVSP